MSGQMQDPRPTPSSPTRLSTTATRRMRPPTPGRIARRRFLVTWTKRLLPVFAVLLLGSIAAWPELMRVQEGSRVTFRRSFGLEADAVRLTDPHYRGVDERGRPYTITADVALQSGPERIDLTTPKGDAVLENGTWIMVQAQRGVFIQHAGQLDLSGDATLYREDGTTMHADTVAIDMKQGAAASDDRTHVEGPFGTLDSQGFALVDKGSVIQFSGPSRLVVNGGAQ